ncbi:hypothetical protein GJ496_008074 [Pomphorhynchus laevis]|nr:hypothetical protein GJ496_008074 [Pomphorhynchus laevis]
MTRPKRCRTMIEAMEDRYSDIDSSLEINDSSCELTFYLPENSPRKNATGRIIASTSMSLNHQDITDIGCTEYLHEACTSTELIDLSNNKLESWTQISELLDTVKNVIHLNLSNNNIYHVPDIWPDTRWESLKILSLNGMHITSFHVIEKLLERLPNLNSLDIAANRLRLSDFKSNFSHCKLEILNLTKNVFNAWTQICKIGVRFPMLNTLILCENPLTNISPMWNWNPNQSFKNLKTLMLSRCYLQSWHTVECFKQFPNLKSIYLSHTPIVQFLPEIVRRDIVTFFLGKRFILNGSEITEEEFETSRDNFLNYYYHVEPKPHRFKEICENIGLEIESRELNSPSRNFILITTRLRNGHFSIRIDEELLISATTEKKTTGEEIAERRFKYEFTRFRIEQW